MYGLFFRLKNSWNTQDIRKIQFNSGAIIDAEIEFIIWLAVRSSKMNQILRLATREGNVELSCPPGIARCVPARKAGSHKQKKHDRHKILTS